MGALHLALTVPSQLMPTYISVLLLIVFAGAGLAAASSRFRRLFSRTPRRFKPKPLLTANEQEFFRRLVLALPEHTVLAQVAMGALLQPAVGSRNKDFWAIRSKFAQKIVDFVILDSKLQVVVLVELDDRMHNKTNDAIRDRMTTEASFRTLRYESRDKPSATAIQKDVYRVERS